MQVRGCHSQEGTRKANIGQQGAILVTALLLLASLSVLGIGAVTLTSTDAQIEGNHKLSVQALYAAEGGVEYGVAKLQQSLQNRLNLTDADLNNLALTKPTLTGYTFDAFMAQRQGASQLQPITTGPFSGLTAVIQPYTITSQASLTGTNARARVVQAVNDNLIPLFQFGIFYQQDLEILPGPTMTFSGGRIHSNGDIYLGSNATLSINSPITTASNIYKRRKDTRPPPSGTVRIKDGDNVYQTMNIDSTSAHWKDDALSLWDGNVKTKVHGIQGLNIPLPAVNSPIDIIKPGIEGEDAALKEAKFYWKAGLRIINGLAYNKNGNVVPLSCYGTPKKCPISPSTPASFYDAREAKNVQATDVDIAALIGHPDAIAALNDPPPGGDPGILYISESGSSRVVRLVNGSQLPPRYGLTVASDNPIYIKGDYNTSNRPAAVIGDAVTILSNGWIDANSTNPMTARVALPTTVNAAIMAGHVPTNGSVYSGGVENFPRFLENWAGITFTYSGSLVSLWNSEKATAIWKDPGVGYGVYNAPNRNWSYGVNLNNLPPGTPRVRTLQRTRWTQVAAQ